MASVTDGGSALAPSAPAGTASGLLLAVGSALSFGLSGPLASGLLSSGWSPGAVVLARLAVAALVLAPLAAVRLRGRWRALAASAPAVLAYGVFAVAGAQFCYFSAVSRMDVGPALLIEYTAPAAVVGWLWVRHGRRPRPLTVAGAVLAAAGLVLVLGLLSGTHLAWSGVLWALGAMVGATVYFVLSADTRSDLPPLVLAGAGLVVGAAVLGGLGLAGLLPVRASRLSPSYAVASAPWWAPLLLLGLVTAALAYSTGIAASRLLGSQLASFVALLEVVAAVGSARVLLGQHPGPVQLAGGLLVVAGVVVVKLADDRAAPTPAPTPAAGGTTATAPPRG